MMLRLMPRVAILFVQEEIRLSAAHRISYLPLKHLFRERAMKSAMFHVAGAGMVLKGQVP